MKRAGIVVVLLVFFLMGFVNADDPVNATSQTQFIHTETSVVVSGDLSNEATIVWQQSSESLDDDVSLSESERLATMSYSESTRANNGYVEYNKVADLDTGNQVINQNNFKSTRQLDFVSSTTRMGASSLMRVWSSIAPAVVPRYLAEPCAHSCRQMTARSLHIATSSRWEVPSRGRPSP